MQNILQILSYTMYFLCGILCYLTAIKGLHSQKNKIGTFLFWFIVGTIFSFGDFIPSVITGALISFLAILTVTKKVTPGTFKTVIDSERLSESERLKNLLFIPAALIGVVSFLLFQIKIDNRTLPSVIAIGGGALVALIVSIIIIKPKLNQTVSDSIRLNMQIGQAAFLPQLLAVVGAIFTISGVGQTISALVSSVIPDGNRIIGVVIYVIGMALFTMIMGNAFAAFAVITSGIGIPFVIAQGGNPAIIGALGMTAGYCGTLMTPMAANFNIVPVALFEMNNRNTVIKTQIPMAISLLLIHIILMLILGF